MISIIFSNMYLSKGIFNIMVTTEGVELRRLDFASVYVEVVKHNITHNF